MEDFYWGRDIQAKFLCWKQYLNSSLKNYPDKEDVKIIINQGTVRVRVYRW